MFLLIIATLYVSLSLLLYLYFTKKPLHISGFSSVGQRRRVLFVIAHPDDECMFFGPSIIALCKGGHRVHVLCLSKGDHEGLGNVRRMELEKSCRTLGVLEENIKIIDDRNLPDHPNLTWDPERICFYIYKEMETHNINTVITFDEGGVSGHYNHTSTHRALWRALFQETLPRGLEVYLLRSTNMVRKYISVFDIIWSLVFSRIVFISNWEDICRAQEAMRCHRSQMVWYRQLYILFSRYFIINTLTPLSLSRKRENQQTRLHQKDDTVTSASNIVAS